jgi:hypothetical protein
VHHGGSLPGFRAVYLRFVNERLPAIALGNGDGDGADMQALALGFATRVLPAAAPTGSTLNDAPNGLSEVLIADARTLP